LYFCAGCRVLTGPVAVISLFFCEECLSISTNLQKRGCNRFEAECVICMLGIFVSVANKGLLDIEAHLEITKHEEYSR
jgi:hypothetical protein